MVQLKDNVSTFLLLSPLDINYLEWLDSGFINAYIGDVNRQELGEKIFMLFEVKDGVKLDELYANKYFLEDYDYNGWYVLVFNFPEEFQRDLEFVKKSEYSKVSKEFKEKFPKKIIYIDEKSKRRYLANSLAHKIINRYSYLLEDLSEFFGMEITEEHEFWKFFSEDSETLDIELFTKNELV